jgi:hypothetical protein
MSLKAYFPAGLTEVTVNGLHQWDYGQKLEIQADDLPAMVEVHFACPGMRDAVVRSCAVIGGVAQAAIPDRCLEQTAPIAAWVYAVGETEGATILTVTLPIIARTQPQPSATVPEDVGDKYTEAVAAMTELVEEAESAVNAAGDAVYDRVKRDIQNGDLTVAKATSAETAETAETARRATDAEHADKATSAETAETAETAYMADEALHAARSDEAAHAASADYASYAQQMFSGSDTRVSVDAPGLYVVVFQYNSHSYSSVIAVHSTKLSQYICGASVYHVDDTTVSHNIVFYPYCSYGHIYVGSNSAAISSCTITAVYRILQF